MPLASFVFVQSEQMKRDIEEMGVNKAKIAAVPMGVSFPMLVKNENDIKFDFMTDKKTIVYIGTLARVRRIDFLVRVLARVLNSLPNVMLILVGDGEEQADRDVLTDEAVRLGIIDAVVITGYLPRNEALKYVAKADVCVSPFYPTPILNSTSPTKIVEYMAMGKPVVANDHPEQRLIINQSKGGLCVPYKEADFADAVVELLSDHRRSVEMGMYGKHYVEVNRSYDKIAQMVESYYFKICT